MKYIKKICLTLLIFITSMSIYAQNNNSGKIVYKSYYPDKKQRNRGVDMTVYFNSNESLLADIKQLKEATGYSGAKWTPYSGLNWTGDSGAKWTPSSGLKQTVFDDDF